MADLKPLKKIVGKARDLRAEHKERHRPSGFGFALADSIDYLDAAHWDEVVAGASVFLSRPYLRALEAAPPANLQQRYAIVFRGREAVACVAAQRVRVSLDRVSSKVRDERLARPLHKLDETLLVCGNLLSWGRHGIAFRSGEDEAALYPAIAEAVYRLRRADRLAGDTDLVMFKDFPAEGTDAADGSDALRRFSYRSLETEPDMVLELGAEWRTFDDYLASLNSRYRKAARQITRDIDARGLTVERTSDLAPHAAALHDLYLQTHAGARLRLVTISPEFLPSLARELGDALRCTLVRDGEQIVGFVTTIRDGDTGVGYYIGFDRLASESAPIYLRLLQATIEDALALGCRRLSLGRTALEPKSRLGARPRPLRVWIRHRVPALNLVVGNLLRTITHDEPPERTPFK